MKILELTPVFGTKTKAQEILLLLAGVKEVVRQGFYSEELDKVELFCKEHHLFLVKSQFKVVLSDNTFYSNQGLKVDSNEDQGMFMVYFSKREDQALLASYYEQINDHRQLGLILGYPSCCVDFFCQNFSPEKTDLELNSTNPWTNLSHRVEDSVLIYHFPCSSDCPESIKLAKQYFLIIVEQDLERGKELLNQLF